MNSTLWTVLIFVSICNIVQTVQIERLQEKDKEIIVQIKEMEK